MHGPAKARTRRLTGALRRHKVALSSLTMRMLGVAAGFALTFLIGHRFGPAANAHYAIVAQTALFLSVMTIGGLDLAVVREFSKSVAAGRPVARSSFLAVLGLTSGIALALCAGLLAFGDQLLTLIGRGEVPAGAMLVLCLILLGRAMTRILAALLRSQRDYVLSQAVETGLIPLLTIMAVLLGLAVSVQQMLWATALAGLLVSVAALVMALRHTEGRGNGVAVSARGLVAFAVPLWGGSVAQNFADWYGLATVSAVNGLYDAGLFRTAAQYAAIFPMVAMGLFTTYSAQISAAVQAGDRAAIAGHARAATRLATVLVLPGTVLAFLFAEPLLRLIGPEFVAGATILRILLVGQLFYCITGPSGLVLALAGHPRWNLHINLAAAALLLVLAPLVARMAGPVGMAGLIAVLLSARNLACFALVWRHEGINVFTGRQRAEFPKEAR